MLLCESTCSNTKATILKYTWMHHQWCNGGGVPWPCDNRPPPHQTHMCSWCTVWGDRTCSSVLSLSTCSRKQQKLRAVPDSQAAACLWRIWPLTPQIARSLEVIICRRRHAFTSPLPPSAWRRDRGLTDGGDPAAETMQSWRDNWRAARSCLMETHFANLSGGRGVRAAAAVSQSNTVFRAFLSSLWYAEAEQIPLFDCDSTQKTLAEDIIQSTWKSVWSILPFTDANISRSVFSHFLMTGWPRLCSNEAELAVSAASL